MASNLNSIFENIKTVIATATGINQVESWPNDVEQFISDVRITTDRLPLAHVSLTGSKTIAEYTSCGIQETSTFRVTVFFSYSRDNMSQLATLRDAINAVMLTSTNLNQGGYADTTRWEGFEVGDQYEDIQSFFIEYEIDHSYARD